MKQARISHPKPRKNRGIAQVVIGCLAALGLLPIAQAADHSSGERPWALEAGLERADFVEVVKKRSQDKMRIVDLEMYRTERVTSFTSVWVDRSVDEEWQLRFNLTLDEFKQAQEKLGADGYSIVDFEIDRFGASLLFSGVWQRLDPAFQTKLYLGMTSIEFSNTYGEMADAGHRLIDFEAYEATGRLLRSGIWMPKKGEKVRFQRDLDLEAYKAKSKELIGEKYRLVEFESYLDEGKQLYASAWQRMASNEKSEMAFDMFPDEFYQKHSQFSAKGYRLTEVEIYETERGVRYAGSWLLGGEAVKILKEAEDQKPVDIFTRPQS